jgi:hypothetical protein
VSLTEAEHLFAGLHETGANDLLQNFFEARPHHLNYRTSPAVADVPPLASAWTTLAPLPFPGVPGGIHFAVQFSIPAIDFHPDTVGVPPPLVFPLGAFSIRTTVTLTLLCGGGGGGDQQGPALARQSASLEVVGLGRVTVQVFGPGQGELGFELQAVEIVDISPQGLESIVECLVLQLLQGVLSSVRLPFSGIPIAGVLTLQLLRGPEVEDDQVKLYGDAV